MMHDHCARAAFLAGILLLTSACGSDDPRTSAPSTAPETPVTDGAQASPPLEGTEPDASTAAATDPTGTVIHVVGLGDSVMATGAGESASIVDVFAAKLKSRGVGGSLVVDNLGDPSTTSDSLLNALESDSAMRDAVAAADIVVVAVGGNDADPFATYPTGICSPGGGASACLAAYAPDLEANLDAIAAAIVELRGDRPIALRFMSPDYNPFVGWGEAPSASFGADFYAQVAGAETGAACAVAQHHGGQCADVFHLFNGPDGTADAAVYLAGDHAHPGSAGIESVANLLIDLGLPELGVDERGGAAGTTSPNTEP